MGITPEEKAEKLTLDYLRLIPRSFGIDPERWNISIKCALLLVDEILESNPTLISCDGNEFNYYYWIKVKS